MSIHFACGGSALALCALLLCLPAPSVLPAADEGGQSSAKPTSGPVEAPQYVSTSPVSPQASDEATEAQPLAPLAAKMLDRQLTGFGNTSPLCLVRNPHVQAALGLTARQLQTIEAIARRNVDASRAGMAQVRRARSPLERREALERAEEALQQRHEETCKALREVLTAAQWRRLSQLALQLRGIDALFCHDVQQAVAMTDRQRFELIKLADEWRYERRELLNRAHSDKQARQRLSQQMDQLDERMEQRLLAVLTPEQRSLFAAMQGEKLDSPELHHMLDRVASLSATAGR